MGTAIDSIRRDIEDLGRRIRMGLPPLPGVRRPPRPPEVPKDLAGEVAKPPAPELLIRPELYPYPMVFRKKIPPSQKLEEFHRVPYDGVVSNVTMHFPPGTSSLVEIRLVYLVGKTKYLLVPAIDDTYIALDGTSMPFPISFPVQRDNRLKVEYYNYDGKYEHTVSVIAILLPLPVNLPQDLARLPEVPLSGLPRT